MKLGISCRSVIYEIKQIFNKISTSAHANYCFQVSKSPEFFDFNVEHLQRLVEHDDLNVSAEADVFWAIRRWYKYDEGSRRCHLPDLVACLRLTQFDIDFLYSHINSLPGCELLVNKAVEWLLRPCARGTISLRYTKPRKALQTEDETYWIVVQTRGDVVNMDLS